MDRRIISLLQKRDESALQMIQSAYGAMCRQIAFRMLGSHEDAEECVSDMLMEIWNLIPPNEPANLSAYLAAIVRRIAVNKYKQAHRQKRGGTEYAAALEELAEIAPFAEQVEQQIEQRELTDAVTAWLRTLPPETARIFMQRYFLSMPVREIAEKQGMGVSAVKMSLMRSREKLREHLKKEGLL